MPARPNNLGPAPLAVAAGGPSCRVPRAYGLASRPLAASRFGRRRVSFAAPARSFTGVRPPDVAVASRPARPT